MKREQISAGARSGFTLVEVLVVLALISMLMFFTVPGLRDVLKGSKLTQASDQLFQDLAVARQTAIKENMAVEVRFYQYPDPDAASGQNQEPITFGAYQFFRLQQDAERPTQYSAPRVPIPVLPQVRKVPQGVALIDSAKWSPLLNNESMQKRQEIVMGLVSGQRDTPAQYVSFIISPDGETSLDKSGARQWFFTLVSDEELQRSQGNPDNMQPRDFMMLQIDPFTANLRLYAPN